MTTTPECPEFAELRECDAFLNSPAYAALSDEERATFVIRYQAAAAKARQAAGRSGPMSAGTKD